MLRNRNLDIAIAAIVAILGGLAAAKHLPGQITIPLGIALFFAPGYLWSEAILSHYLPGIERAMFTAGMAFIFPILGGFLFYGLHIPLFQSSWVGLLVVLTLLGVVATAIERLRQAPEQSQYRQQQQPRRNPREPQQGSSVALNGAIFGLAALIALGAVGYSVKSAEAQKFAGYTMFSMTPVVNNSLAKNTAALSNNTKLQNDAADDQNTLTGTATTAHLYVADHEGGPEQYQVVLYRQGKVSNKWAVSLNDGQSWQVTISYTSPAPTGPQKNVVYAMLADLYTLPNTTTPSNYTDNGGCVTNIKVYPANIQSEDPCYPKLLKDGGRHLNSAMCMDW
jgi:hypothetical protein